MATSESSLSFVPRRVKAPAARPPPPSAPDRFGAVPSSVGFKTSYPRDVLLRVSLRADVALEKAEDSVKRVEAQSRRVLEKLVSHSVDYVHVEQAASALEANAEEDAQEKKQWTTIIVRTPSSSCAQALLAALLQHNYKAEILSSEAQADHWRGVPEAIKNRARGRSERGSYALRKSRAAASQQRSRRR